MPTMRTLFSCVALLSILAGLIQGRIPFHKEACDRGTRCSQCPEGSYIREPVDGGRDSELLCCPGCANSTMFFSILARNPSCYCLTSDLKNSRHFRFPETFGSTRNDLDVASSQDTNYILNKATKNSNSIHEALGLIVAALEDLDYRLTNIENRLSERGFLQSSESGVNRLGLGEVPSGPCPNANFTRGPYTGRCYYASVINKDRKSWQDALASCESMGATLAEPKEVREPRGDFFSDLSAHLAQNDKTAGFGFWIGGIYLDSWRWINSAEKVSRNRDYWAYRDSQDIIRTPGDTAGGRCLSFRYILDKKSYAYSADECPMEKYYACEMLEKRHRHFS